MTERAEKAGNTAVQIPGGTVNFVLKLAEFTIIPLKCTALVLRLQETI